jgi:hypothetical protein
MYPAENENHWLGVKLTSMPVDQLVSFCRPSRDSM